MQFVQHQLHPQFAGLVLHDKQHFVVVGAAWVLGIQYLPERQIIAVAHGLAKVGFSARLRQHGGRSVVWQRLGRLCHGVKSQR